MIGITPPLSNAFRRIGWGLVFILLDLYIVGLDILPDFIGYIMIALALRDLSRKHDSFVRAKWVAFVLIVGSLPEVIQGAQISFLNLLDKPLQLSFLSVVVLMLHTLLVYWIFQGLIAIAWVHELRELRHTTAMRRAFYLIVNVSILIFLPFVLNAPDVLAVSVLPFCGLLSLLAEFLLLRLAYRYAKEYINEAKV
ncbi:hypothetical protein [Paenibacillus sp. SN-8-1]|uniref:hypothetical protein n=1 Tax=Paenibacillus sp. SN-8-1 TaxID=3435409 RepID=UPI003D9A2431